MRKVINIGQETTQRHTILFNESEITLTLHYYPTVEMWAMDVQYKDFFIYGVALAVNVLHIESANQPFGFLVQDVSGNGMDPFRRSDFEQGRCVLYLLEPEDMRSIRGVEVPL